MIMVLEGALLGFAGGVVRLSSAALFSTGIGSRWETRALLWL